MRILSLKMDPLASKLSRLCLRYDWKHLFPQCYAPSHSVHSAALRNDLFQPRVVIESKGRPPVGSSLHGEPKRGESDSSSNLNNINKVNKKKPTSAAVHFVNNDITIDDNEEEEWSDSNSPPRSHRSTHQGSYRSPTENSERDELYNSNSMVGKSGLSALIMRERERERGEPAASMTPQWWNINSSGAEEEEGEDEEFIDNDDDENDPRIVNKAMTPSTPSTKKRAQDFKRIRYELAQTLFNEYNTIVFQNRLPSDLCLSWNKRLLTKAGCTLLREQKGDKSTREAKIELSDKVLTDMFRLKSTLLHEMVHAANWLLDGVGAESKHHGPEFKKWVDVIHSRVPEVEITTYHSYDIHKSHHFGCTGEDCGAKFMRHSKKGLDITKRVCGRCKSKIEYVGKFNENGEAETPRTPSKYSNFVKENYKAIRRRYSKLGRGEIMSKIAEAYRETEASKKIELQEG